jgi:hypothetical protein
VQEKAHTLANLLHIDVGELGKLLDHVGLSERQRDILRRYYGIGCRAETLGSIGNSSGCSHERIRQIKVKGEQILAHAIRNQSEVKDKHILDWTVDQFFTRERAAEAGIGSDFTLVRLTNCLKHEYKYGYQRFRKWSTDGDVTMRWVLDRTTHEILCIPNSGRKTFNAIQAMLATAGLALKEWSIDSQRN